MPTRRIVAALAFFGLCACASAQPNVLFIIVDDLRPELPVYGQEQVQAPHIDTLAAQGVVFTNAYANVPVCGASRASMMSGLRPTATRFVGFDARVDVDAPDVVPLHALLKANGYHTESLGKVLHHQDDSPGGWSLPPWSAQDDVPRRLATGFRNYQDPANVAAFKETGIGPATEAPDVEDDAYFDGQTASRAVASLERLAAGDKPFFLAVGFVKPHLPFTAPRKYWDLYAREDIPLARVAAMPEGLPRQARHTFGELRRYSDVPDDPEAAIDDRLARKLKHGYFASVSYADAQVGRVLNKLEALELDSSTIVILIGDHGWSLGEHGLWAKHSPFDVATRIPMIVRAPGRGDPGTAEALVELVDIYPTLVSMLDLPAPAHLQGDSFVAVLEDATVPGKPAVFPRWKSADVVRSQQYALTRWSNTKGRPVAEMMFDHATDPDETVNIARDENYSLQKSMLESLLKSLAHEEKQEGGL
jgi:arylsulfatase A-like enzyme